MPNADRTHLVDRAISFVKTNFPGLDHMLNKGIPLSLGYRVGDGACANSDAAQKTWFDSSGYKTFAEAVPPGGFCFVGIQNRGSSEYLVAMLAHDDRRFWFYDSYVCFVAETDHSIAGTRQALNDCLAKWQRGEQRILYSGPQGGYIGCNFDPHWME